MDEKVFEQQLAELMEQTPREAIHHFLFDVRDYIGLVNKIAELMRMTETISESKLDEQTKVGEVMLWLLQRGEKLRTSADMLHEYASQLDQ